MGAVVSAGCRDASLCEARDGLCLIDGRSTPGVKTTGLGFRFLNDRPLELDPQSSANRGLFVLPSPEAPGRLALVNLYFLQSPLSQPESAKLFHKILRNNSMYFSLDGYVAWL